jgi:hypothetical protein
LLIGFIESRTKLLWNFKSVAAKSDISSSCTRRSRGVPGALSPAALALMDVRDTLEWGADGSMRKAAAAAHISPTRCERPSMFAVLERQWTGWAHTGGGNALAFKQPT